MQAWLYIVQAKQCKQQDWELLQLPVIANEENIRQIQ